MEFVENKKMKIDYKSSGVNVEIGDEVVDWLKEEENSRPSIFKNNMIEGIGGFASLFRWDFSKMKKPCLVTCTDGVGTKVKIASYFNDYSKVGQDLVAMCVNDLICTGAQPLLFLDYYATGKLKIEMARAFLAGVREACEESQCALVGGETAEMPGVYQENDFDCAGFAVGVVDEDQALGSHRVKVGDCVIGISSSGFHSNGYSLLRKVFANDLDKWRDDLLRPTFLYARVAKKIMEKAEVHAFAHITGGGVENIPRIIPEGYEWEMMEWEIPSLFKEVQQRTGLTDFELKRTLNCGVGFVVVLPEKEKEIVCEIIKSEGYSFFNLGTIRKKNVKRE